MVAASWQLLAAGLHRGTEFRVVLLLVAGAAQPPVGVGVGKVGHTVVPHALRELAHLLHNGWVPGLFMLAAWGQVAALLRRGTELRVVLLLVASAAELPVGLGVGKVGHTVAPHALRVPPTGLLPIPRRRVRVRTPARGQRE